LGHARPLDLRSARAWFPRDCRLRPTTSGSRPLVSRCWSGRRPATRSAENDQNPVAPRARTVGRKPVRRAAATPIDHSGTRTPTDLIPLSRKRGGRSFGAALSEVAIVRTPTSSAGLAAGQAMSRSPSGARRFRGWRQRFGARVMPYVGSDRWWLNRLAPLRCLDARYTRARKNARDPLRPSPPTAPPLAVRSDPSHTIRDCLAGHA
jgi:hypothetical protein